MAANTHMTTITTIGAEATRTTIIEATEIIIEISIRTRIKILKRILGCRSRIEVRGCYSLLCDSLRVFGGYANVLIVRVILSVARFYHSVIYDIVFSLITLFMLLVVFIYTPISFHIYFDIPRNGYRWNPLGWYN